MKPNLDLLLELDSLREDQIKDFETKDHSIRAFQILLFRNNHIGDKETVDYDLKFNRILKEYLQSQVFIVATSISIKDYLDFKNNVSPSPFSVQMPHTIAALKKMEKEGLSECNRVYSYVMSCSLSRLYDEWVIISDEQE